MYTRALEPILTGRAMPIVNAEMYDSPYLLCHDVAESFHNPALIRNQVD
jgi:hypothetical protein